MAAIRAGLFVCLFIFLFNHIDRIFDTGIRACQQPTISEKMFYNGYDLVEYFMRDANEKMVDYMNESAAK
jgi:hypothetical protein